MSGARYSSSWVAYEPVHKVHRAGVEDGHVRRSPRRPRDTTWSSSWITAFARKVVRVRLVGCRAMRVVALSRSLAGETARTTRHARRRERRAARANVKCDRDCGCAVTLVGGFGRSIWAFRRVNHSRTRRNWRVRVSVGGWAGQSWGGILKNGQRLISLRMYSSAGRSLNVI